jgi:hypothetical protein
MEAAVTEGRKRKSAGEVYSVVADKAKKLYHIAHGRRENTSPPYDSERLRTISRESVDGDVDRLRSASELFKERSVTRP